MMRVLLWFVFSFGLVSTSSISPHSPYPQGSCSEPAAGFLSGASVEHSGVTSLQTCAQYAFDMNQISASKDIAFVAFGNVEDGTAVCAWFSRCACALGGVCRPGNFVSVQISDVIKPSTTGSTIPIEHGNYEVSASPVTQSADPLAKDSEECADNFSDLMRTFQSKCEFTRTLAYKRFVAMCVVIASLAVCAAGFGLAYHLDRKAGDSSSSN